eukprot:SAG31_NODE_2238_length_6119_cov_3.847508_3_plen_186_part_00
MAQGHFLSLPFNLATWQRRRSSEQCEWSSRLLTRVGMPLDIWISCLVQQSVCFGGFYRTFRFSPVDLRMRAGICTKHEVLSAICVKIRSRIDRQDNGQLIIGWVLDSGEDNSEGVGCRGPAFEPATYEPVFTGLAPPAFGAVRVSMPITFEVLPSFGPTIAAERLTHGTLNFQVRCPPTMLYIPR